MFDGKVAFKVKFHLYLRWKMDLFSSKLSQIQESKKIVDRIDLVTKILYNSDMYIYVTT